MTNKKQNTIEVVRDVKQGELESAYAVGAFDKAKDAIENDGYRVISLQENARLRMQEGADSSVSQRGNWTREGVLYVPKKGIYLVRDSPILDNAEEATNYHRNSKEFYLTNEQVEKSLVDSVKFKGSEIPTNSFAENPITAFAFGKYAKAYGEFLKEAEIDSIETYAASTGNKPFARQMWLLRLNDVDRSDLGGGSRILNCGEVRGVREK